MKLFGMILLLCLLPVYIVHGQNAQSKSALRFELSFPASVRSTAADGRVFVMLSTAKDPEPRLRIRDYLLATPFFGANVDGLKPGTAAVINDDADGYPVERLHKLPLGDYYVQGMLSLYTTFHRADGHTVKMHMDQWEGQHFQRSPGNLYSAVQKVHLDPAVGGSVKISLDKVIPPIQTPADTEH